MNKRIFLSPPHMSGMEEGYIKEAFETNWIAPLGPNVEAFEQQIKDYVGTKGALALSSGTAGIHLALRLLGVKDGDTVFCPTLTFVASANPILYQGATPIFIDSDYETWNMSHIALEKAFVDAKKAGKLPKAVIVANLYGQSADMDPILDLCNQYNVPLVEDAAESLGAKYKGKSSGTFGKFGIYSFNGNKIITTSGGGMLVSDNQEMLDKAKFWATQARDQASHYQHSEMGYNYRLSNVLAGIGRAQLSVLDERVGKRREIFNKYYEALKDIEGIEFMPEPSDYYSTRWLTTLRIDQNKINLSPVEIIDYLEKSNIESRQVWKPMHLQPLFKDALYYTHNETSVSDELFSNGLCLPSGSSLSDDEQTFVIDKLLSILKE